MNDDVVPANSADSSVPRFSWTPYKGTVGYWPEVHTTGTWVLELPRAKEWVEYRYSQPQRFSSVEVYWADDSNTRGRCRIPRSWRVLFRDGQEWRPVEAAAAYGTEIDTFNRVEFQPVETTALRIEAELGPRFSAGIFEWRVSG
ncbi:MAG: hypothetical protein GY953_51880 [bacterium]|nr:hypothetical protein [bacterium]